MKFISSRLLWSYSCLNIISEYLDPTFVLSLALQRFNFILILSLLFSNKTFILCHIRYPYLVDLKLSIAAFIFLVSSPKKFKYAIFSLINRKISVNRPLLMNTPSYFQKFSSPRQWSCIIFDRRQNYDAINQVSLSRWTGCWSAANVLTFFLSRKTSHLSIFKRARYYNEGKRENWSVACIISMRYIFGMQLRREMRCVLSHSRTHQLSLLARLNNKWNVNLTPKDKEHYCQKSKVSGVWRVWGA